MHMMEGQRRSWSSGIPSHFQVSADLFPPPQDRTHADMGLGWILEHNCQIIPAHPYEDDSKQIIGVMH